MAQTSGRLGKLYVSAAGSTYTAVGDVTSLDYNFSHDTEDRTTFDSAGYKESEYGDSQAKISATFKKDETDAGQDIIRTAFGSKAQLYFQYRPYDSSGYEKFTSLGKINSLSSSNAANASVECKLDAETSGTITIGSI